MLKYPNWNFFSPLSFSGTGRILRRLHFSQFGDDALPQIRGLGALHYMLSGDNKCWNRRYAHLSASGFFFGHHVTVGVR